MEKFHSISEDGLFVAKRLDFIKQLVVGGGAAGGELFIF